MPDSSAGVPALVACLVILIVALVGVYLTASHGLGWADGAASIVIGTVRA